MTRYIIFIYLMALSLSVISQRPEQGDLKKIEAARIALITERLELTPEQAEKFWPIYREFDKQRKEIGLEYHTTRKNFDPNQATEEENKKMLELANSVKEQQLKLEQEYAQRLLKVITPRQLNNLRRAESDFKEMLLKRIRSGRMNRKQQRQRNDGSLNYRDY